MNKLAINPGKLIGRGRTAEIYARGDRQVLKLFYDWCPPHWAENEARITRVIYDQGISVPQVFDMVEIEGRKGIILEMIDGTTMLEEIRTKPWRMVDIARKMAELQAKLHIIQIPGLYSLKECLEHDIRQVEFLPEERKKEIIEILRQMPEGAQVCHYDFHPNNVLISPRGMVIIDWSCPMQGDPLADVARTSLLLSLGEPAPGTPGRFLIQRFRSLFQHAYLKQYLQLRPGSEERILAWKLPVAAARLHENIPSEREKLLCLIKKGMKVGA